MQIDFHHAVTYLISRLAGFTANHASIISYCSQYVDDATNSGKIKFTNGAMYSRISSAHKMLDSRNFSALANQLVWIPFHFLPGNGGKQAGDNPDGTFINKLVCTPDSHIAQDMVSCCVKDADKPYALHRLGITLHVLADTFSHRGFAGVSHKINDVRSLNNDINLFPKRSCSDYIDSVKSLFVKKVLPLGHGAALTCPDIPFLKWEYTNGLGQDIIRDNPPMYLHAVKSMYEAIVQFRESTGLKVNNQIQKDDLDIIQKNIAEFNDEEGEVRHKKWVGSILSGRFSFQPEQNEKIEYIDKGKGSWKYEALDTEKKKDYRKDRFEYRPEFLQSNWKYFHDALQIHRFEVLHDILPIYGICGA